jgi:hypothetical protein
MILPKRIKNEGILSVGEVNEILDQLFLKQNNEKEKLDLLSKIIFNCGSLEQKWILKIMLKNQSTFGLTEKRIFNFFHSDAEKCFLFFIFFKFLI